MKNRIIGGLGAILTGGLVAIGPQTIFKICEQSHHTGPSVCFWTSRAVIGTGVVFALLGISYILSRSPLLRAGLSFAAAANVILTFLLANVLIGMDSDAMMACRVKTLPALNVISTIVFALAAGNFVWLIRGNPPGAKGEAVHETEKAYVL
jgi:hypothetical protein